MKTPPVNARLTAITAPGFSADYDEPGSDGALRWSGDAPAYLTERTLSEVSNGALDQVVETRLVVPSNLAELQTGDVVTYVKNGTSSSRRVRNVEERSDFGFIRVSLWDS